MFITAQRSLRRAALISIVGTLGLGATAHAQIPSGLSLPKLNEANFRPVTVDAASATGTIRSLQGVNGTPHPHAPLRRDILQFADSFRPEESVRPAGVDVTPAYEKMRVDTVRTHDWWGVGDVDARFGGDRMVMTDGRAFPRSPEEAAAIDALSIFPNMDADPADPASYNFGPTDKAIQSVANMRASIFFRIGRGQAGQTQPPDPKKYAEITKYIVRHYNHGWANGYRLGIKYWEVWNEPDAAVFWTGTPAQYVELYAAVARAVKSVDRALLVGGPAIAQPQYKSPYLEEFLDAVKKQRIPLDFYSWHYYGGAGRNDPYNFIRIANYIKQALDSRGLGKAQSIISEWNTGYGVAPHLGASQRAAFVASVSMYMQDAPIDLAYFYRGDALARRDGATLDKTGLAFAAVGQMAETPLRLKTQGQDDIGFAVLAGKSRDGETHQVLISNFQPPPLSKVDMEKEKLVDQYFNSHPVWLTPRVLEYRQNDGYDLHITGLVQGRKYVLERFRVGDGQDYESIEKISVSGPDVHIANFLPPSAVEMIVLIAR